jgi:hypothetical protein
MVGRGRRLPAEQDGARGDIRRADGGRFEARAWFRASHRRRGAPFHEGAISARSAALAELAALTGDPKVLCADMGDGQPGDPAHDKADCPGLCCHLSHGLAFALPPPAFSPTVPSLISVTISTPHPILLVVSAHAPSAQPRGPPLSA